MSFVKTSQSVDFFLDPAQKLRFQAMVWVVALVIGYWTVGYNLAFAIDEVSFKSFLIGIIINSTLLIILFFSIEIYKSSYFSGFPLINKNSSKALSYLKRVFCFWITGKLIDIVLSVVLLSTGLLSTLGLYEFAAKGKMQGFFLYGTYVVELLITEVWPGLVVLKKSFVNIFLPVGITSGSPEPLTQNLTDRDLSVISDYEEGGVADYQFSQTSQKKVKQSGRKINPETLIIPNVVSLYQDL